MRRMTFTLAAVSLALAACSDGNGPGSQPGVSLSFTARRAAGVAASPAMFFGAFASDTLSDGQSNELIVDKVELVLREIELERVEVVDCDVEPEPDGCEEFETGPILVDLPLNGQTRQELSIQVPEGMYDEIEFELHKVSSDDPEDEAFRTAHPDFVDKSIRVTGTFNGQAFTYETDLNVEQELDLNPVLTVDANTTTTNVTIRIDVDQWFRTAAGVLVDPDTANKGGDNENLVKDNIKDSIEAFEDQDGDGDDSDES